ncbi:hypothetical protein COLO4_09968 [Corchorus olitorius]|uniref:Uncharacterized protein n=1 Tax=Corchorus olitorius TaxID=93759 RepID=A0A1R3KAF3_9ROSI|nr:hypothetical protein COLO4_09968 [Corchorus olitorius]
MKKVCLKTASQRENEDPRARLRAKFLQSVQIGSGRKLVCTCGM